MALNILIVDDSGTVRAVIKKTLGISGIPINELYEAGNGKEAIDVLADAWVDLILADLNMPIMGGVEMIEKLSEDGILKKIPIIVISTEGSQTRIEELKSKGVRAFIRKPFTPEIIKNVIEDITGALDEG